MTEKICIVLTPGIGKLNSKGIAGTEKMFLKDVAFLRKTHVVQAFARFRYSSPLVRKLPYFLFLLEWSSFIHRKLKKKTSFQFQQFCKFLTDVCYVLSMRLSSAPANMYIGYSFPLITLLNKKNTTVIFQANDEIFFPKLLHSFYKKAHYIFVSEYLRKSYLKKYKFLSQKNTSVLHNSADLSVFKPAKNSTSHKKIGVLYASAWEELKGLHLLLEANKKLHPKLREKLEIVIASRSDLWYHEKFDSNEKYVRYIHTLLTDVQNVKLLGGVHPQKMPKMYQNSDYLFFPSTWGEPCSLTLIESLACGLPVIAFDVGGNGEILSPKNSVVLKNISVQSVLDVLKKIAKKSLRKKSKKNLFTDKNLFMSEKKREQKLRELLS
jgi:glycosyltransferase involved in cell wall biosynthesis